MPSHIGAQRLVHRSAGARRCISADIDGSTSSQNASIAPAAPASFRLVWSSGPTVVKSDNSWARTRSTAVGRTQGRKAPFDEGEAVAVGVFAGIPVLDYTRAVEWYERLLGRAPSFFPNDVEAVWQLAEDRYVYIIEDHQRAGGAVCMIWVDDPVAEVAKIAERGLEPDDLEKHDTVWKYVFHDAHGNEIGIGGDTASRGPE
jgi:hypothetical protein